MQKNRLHPTSEIATMHLLMSSMMLMYGLDKKTHEQVENLARMTGKPEKTVIVELVKAGLRSYQTAPSKSVRAALDLIAWAEKEQIKGKVDDLSTNHNKYACG